MAIISVLCKNNTDVVRSRWGNEIKYLEPSPLDSSMLIAIIDSSLQWKKVKSGYHEVAQDY